MTAKTVLLSGGTDSDVSKSLNDFINENKGRRTFLEHEIKGLLKGMGFAVPNGRFLRVGEAISPQFGLNYPLVAKVSSSKIVSKSNVGGVRTGIANDGELREVVQELYRIESAEGVLVEEMALEGVEVVVGGVIDTQFGPIVMFGLGGIFIELFKDVAFGLAPLGSEDALRLIRQVKGYELLEGYRGKPPVDKDALIRVVVAVSEIIASGVVSEIDLNPVALYPESLLILDAKMQLVS